MKDYISHRELTKQEERKLLSCPETDTFLWHNANPYGKLTTDCVVRAISTAADLPYNIVFDGLVAVAHKTGYHITDPYCFKRYLESIGFIALNMPKRLDGTRFTGDDYCRWLSSNKLDRIHSLVANIGAHHTVCIKPTEHGDGIGKRFKVLDTWKSSNGYIGKMWVLYDQNQNVEKCSP